MPSFAFNSSMSPIDLKPWTIPPGYEFAGITIATLKFTAIWPNGQDIIESSIPFFIKGSLKSDVGSNSASLGIDVSSECDSLIKGKIATKDNQYFVYKATASYEDAPRICACFHMVLASLDATNKKAIGLNVLGTIGEGTVWLQDFNNLHNSERITAFVANNNIVVQKYTVAVPQQFYVICKPKF